MPIEDIDRKILKIEGEVHKEVDPEYNQDELVSDDSGDEESSEDSAAGLLNEETNVTTLDLIKKLGPRILKYKIKILNKRTTKNY